MQKVNRRLHGPSYNIQNLTPVWKSQAVSESLKLPRARATAFSVAAYDCESWFFSKKVKKKVEALKCEPTGVCSACHGESTRLTTGFLNKREQRQYF